MKIVDCTGEPGFSVASGRKPLKRIPGAEHTVELTQFMGGRFGDGHGDLPGQDFPNGRSGVLRRDQSVGIPDLGLESDRRDMNNHKTKKFKGAQDKHEFVFCLDLNFPPLIQAQHVLLVSRENE